MLALLAGRALVALAAEYRREAGDALTVEAAEAGLAVACRLALLTAAVGPTVAMLTLLSDRAAVRLAAEHRREPGDAAALRAQQTRRAIARRVALLAQLGDADLRGAIAAG